MIILHKDMNDLIRNSSSEPIKLKKKINIENDEI